MKKLISLVLTAAAMLSLTMPAGADVLWEPEDSFYEKHRDECTYENRRYELAGYDGSVTLWSAPNGTAQRELPNGGQGNKWKTPLSKKVYCGVCGYAIIRRGTQNRYYCCQTPQTVPWMECYPEKIFESEILDTAIGKVKAPKKTSRKRRKAEPKPMADFQPYKGKIRKPGTGCISQISESLWEGRYSPVWPDGKKHPRNIYAHSREECEEKLTEMIAHVKAEIAAAKAAAQQYQLVDPNRRQTL